MKLWYFRTTESRYGLAGAELDADDMKRFDARWTRCPEDVIYLGSEKPRGFPALKSGECIAANVTVAAVKPRRQAKRAKRGDDAN